MRPAIMRAYAAMLPRLQAEEDMRLIVALAAGTGAMRKEARNKYLRDLSRTSEMRRARKATLADVEAMGIRVVTKPVG